MSGKKRTPAEAMPAATPIEMDARRTRERLRTLERHNPLRERATSGDNTPWADSLEELHDDMAKKEYLAVREVLSFRLKTFTRAQEKLWGGTYGFCDRCEDKIPPARLRAVPEAVHCVRCAELAEREQATRREPPWVAEYQLAAA